MRWGRLSRFALLAGYRHESPAVPGLLAGLSFGALLADRGFDSDRLRALLASLGAEAVAPPKSNRTEAIACDMEKYARRHRVENFFCRIKNFRRIATATTDRVELRGDDPHGRRLARAGLIVNAP